MENTSRYLERILKRVRESFRKPNNRNKEEPQDPATPTSTKHKNIYVYVER